MPPIADLVGGKYSRGEKPPPVLTPAFGTIYNPAMTLTDAEYSRYGIDFLYYLTHVDNMPSIREHGWFRFVLAVFNFTILPKR